MTKRQASEPLETIYTDSPASKKVRLEDARAEDGSTPDILGAAEELNEELAEAGAVEDMAEQEEEEEEDEHTPVRSRQKAPLEGYDNLYLDTINRGLLDFDFEKLCSVTLSNINVYACLVCGKYYQGRGPKSQAYFHALEAGHHVYINMQTKQVYVLPEGYEVASKSLDDIKFVVDPWLPRNEVLGLDKQEKTAWDLLGRKYTPGFVGMNNIKANDYFNAVVQALAHVAPLRNFFMLERLPASAPQLAHRFSVLVRKIWNPRAFKAHVSPHELLQEVSQRSAKRFSLAVQADPVDFLTWFLHHLHAALGGSSSSSSSGNRTAGRSSIVQRVFQGRLKMESQAITARASASDRLRFEDSAAVTATVTPYMVLTLDLPAAPLFQDELDRNMIPQVPLSSLLSKYDGVQAQERLNTRVRYRLLHPLPPVLALHVRRFSASKFVAEQRNPTIVTFAVRSLDMAPYVEPNPAVFPPGEPIWYDLVANVTHEAVRIREDSVEGEAEGKLWRVQLRDKAKGEWVQVQDLFVEPQSGETVFTKESYVMFWERRRVERPKGKE